MAALFCSCATLCRQESMFEGMHTVTSHPISMQGQLATGNPRFHSLMLSSSRDRPYSGAISKCGGALALRANHQQVPAATQRRCRSEWPHRIDDQGKGSCIFGQIAGHERLAAIFDHAANPQHMACHPVLGCRRVSPSHAQILPLNRLSRGYAAESGRSKG